MTDDLMLRRKWTVRSPQGDTLVLIKKSNEKSSHVVMKALLWGLFRGDHPDLTVERSIGQRYKPDLVAFEGGVVERPRDHPAFWAECGQVAVAKLETLFRRYRRTHFVIAKWEKAAEWSGILTRLCRGLQRQAPVDLLVFPADSGTRFVDAQGRIELTVADLNWSRYE